METIGLLNKLNTIAILHKDLQEAIKPFLIEELFPRKTLLLNAGQASQRIYFIKKDLPGTLSRKR